MTAKARGSVTFVTLPQSIEKAQLKLDFFDRLTPGIHISGCREFVPF